MLKNIKLEAKLDEIGKISLNLNKVNDREFEIEQNDYAKGRLYLDRIDNTYIIRCDVEIIPYPYDYIRTFNSSQGIALELSGEQFSTFKGLAIERFNPFWTRPHFFDDFTKLHDNTQQLLIESENQYIHVMPISGAKCQTCARPGSKQNILRLTAGTYCGGVTKIEAPICVISVSDNPYKSVKVSYDTAFESGIIITPPKENKIYPLHLKGLGWCTWDAFYHDVTSTKIEEKLIEFKEKNVPVKWIMIDDGWAQTEDFRLKSCFVDEEKFPGGLKKFIKHIKEEYAIEYVGIWHAFTGYWYGIDKQSELYSLNKNNFTEVSAGIIMPSGEEEYAYNFFSGWHQYLREQGVDFLKIDTQGNAFEFYKNYPNPCEKTVNLHNAIENSVSENFDSVVINCMGMSSLNMFSRRKSCLVRNSDDFFPDKEDGFESHITQNAYNAIFSDNLFYCDYDMWWTRHFSAKQSSVLRAISGGPVYVSDKIGETDKEYLLPIIDSQGNVLRCDNAAKPTADCIFKNPHGRILKIFNNVGKNIVIALFNLSDKKQKEQIYLKDVFAEGRFHMHCYFSGKCEEFVDGMTFEMAPNDVEIINLYQINDGEYEPGDTSKYISVATI